MADPTVDILGYFFSFLKNVSLRASENKIDSSNLADFILEKIPSMLGIDGLYTTPSLEGFEGNCESPGECKRKRRHSAGDFVNGALNKLKSSRTSTR